MMVLIETIAPFAKAVIGSIVAGLGSIATALDDGHVGWQEAITAIIVFLVAFVAVFNVPNKPKPPV